MTDSLAESFGLKEAKGALVSERHQGLARRQGGHPSGATSSSPLQGKKSRMSSDLPRLVAAIPVGKNDQNGTICGTEKPSRSTVTVGKLAETEEKAEDNPGLRPGTSASTMTDVTPEAARTYSLPGDKGALITDVDPSGPAADADLHPGDLIIEVDGRRVNTATISLRWSARPKRGRCCAFWCKGRWLLHDPSGGRIFRESHPGKRPRHRRRGLCLGAHSAGRVVRLAGQRSFGVLRMTACSHLITSAERRP